jgi:alkylation response protein AidB-like acyl-CoA dehydrogenase
MAMLVPEEYGGGCVSGRALADLTVILEERGRTLQPGPIVASNVVAFAIAEYGSAQQRLTYLPKLAAAQTIATWALADTAYKWSPDGVIAEETPDGYTLNGIKTLVPDTEIADLVLVTAVLNGAAAQFLVHAGTPGLSATSLTPLDITRRLGQLEFRDVALPHDARLGSDASADIERQLQLAIVLSVAETVGSMDRIFEVTLQYAKDRVAFGRTIGSFQAIKHLLADLSLVLEASKAGVSAAIDAVQERQTTAGEVVSMAKAYIANAATELAQGCLQIHGGIGYTWEHDMHLYYRRLAGDSITFGDAAWHRERICALHGL